MKQLTGRTRFEAEPTKNSRFIVTAAPVEDESEAQALLRAVAAEMPDANHHCWAWRIAVPSIDRAGDDGEPSGSAGRPILAQLSGHDLVNSAVIVTRYFGGTKLGVGGLVRAYGGAAGEAIAIAPSVPWELHTQLIVVHSHGDLNGVERVLSEFAASTLTIEYGTEVSRTVSLSASKLGKFQTALADTTAGRALLGEATAD